MCGTQEIPLLLILSNFNAVMMFFPSTRETIMCSDFYTLNCVSNCVHIYIHIFIVPAKFSVQSKWFVMSFLNLLQMCPTAYYKSDFHSFSSSFFFFLLLVFAFNVMSILDYTKDITIEEVCSRYPTPPLPKNSLSV
jgi:hypothetical protein